MSLNRKRRIFRPGTGTPHLRGWGGLPSRSLFISLGCVIGVILALYLSLRPSTVPAAAQATAQIVASPGDLAVVDGETLRVGRQVVKLEGIVAPARGSSCGDVDCAVAAANALAALVRNSAVACMIHGRDGRGRPTGNCLAGNIKLNEALVRDGWAHAETASLRDSEESARLARRGIWRAGF